MSEPRQNWWRQMPLGVRWCLSILMGLAVLIGSWWGLTGDEAAPDNSDLFFELETTRQPADLYEQLAELKQILNLHDSGIEDVYITWTLRFQKPENAPTLAEIEHLLSAQARADELLDELLLEPIWNWGFDPDAGAESMMFELPLAGVAQMANRHLLLKAWYHRQRGDRETWCAELRRAAQLENRLKSDNQTLVNVLVIAAVRTSYLDELEQAWLESGWRPEGNMIPEQFSSAVVAEAFTNQYRLVSSNIVQIDQSPDEFVEQATEFVFAGDLRKAIGLIRLGGIAPNRCKRLLGEYYRAAIMEMDTGETGLVERIELARMFDSGRDQRVSEFLRHRNAGGWLVLNLSPTAVGQVRDMLKLKGARRRMFVAAVDLQRWEEEKSELPSSLRELVDAGWWEEIPADPMSPMGSGVLGYDPQRRLLWVEGRDGNPSWSPAQASEAERAASESRIYIEDRQNKQACPQLQIPELKPMEEGQ